MKAYLLNGDITASEYLTKRHNNVVYCKCAFYKNKQLLRVYKQFFKQFYFNLLFMTNYILNSSVCDYISTQQYRHSTCTNWCCTDLKIPVATCTKSCTQHVHVIQTNLTHCQIYLSAQPKSYEGLSISLLYKVNNKTANAK